MSGYIRLNKGLRDNIKARRLRALTKLSLRDLLGALALFWSMADDHADILWTDGYGPESKTGDEPGMIPKGVYFDAVLEGWTAEAIDDVCATPGFAQALADKEVGWLRLRKRSAIIPDFTKFNNSVKQRALAAARQKAHRARSVQHVTRHDPATSPPPTNDAPVTRHVSPQPSQPSQASQSQPNQAKTSQPAQPSPTPLAETATGGGPDAPEEFSSHGSAGGPRAAAPDTKQHRRLILAGVRPDHPDVGRWASDPRLTGEFLDDLLRRRMAKRAGAGWIVNAIKSHLGEAVE